MRTMLCCVLSMTLPIAAQAQDPTSTDGDKYRVVLENDVVRVLDYQDLPGQQTAAHAHPDFVLVALSAFERRLTLGDGRVLERRFRAGDVMWSAAQQHVGQNIGASPTHVLIVEMKKRPADGAGRCGSD